MITVKEKDTCIICGKPVYKSQGIIIKTSGDTLVFHSSKCAARFLKILLEDTEQEQCINKILKNALEVIKRQKEELMKKTAKKIV